MLQINIISFGSLTASELHFIVNAIWSIDHKDWLKAKRNELGIEVYLRKIAIFRVSYLTICVAFKNVACAQNQHHMSWQACPNPWHTVQSKSAEEKSVKLWPNQKSFMS